MKKLWGRGVNARECQKLMEAEQITVLMYSHLPQVHSGWKWDFFCWLGDFGFANRFLMTVTRGKCSGRCQTGWWGRDIGGFRAFLLQVQAAWADIQLTPQSPEVLDLIKLPKSKLCAGGGRSWILVMWYLQSSGSVTNCLLSWGIKGERRKKKKICFLITANTRILKWC